MMDNQKIVKKILIVLLGIVISVIGAMLWTTNGFQSDGFLQLGEIYHFSKEEMKTGTESCIYDSDSGRFLIQSDPAELYFYVNSENLKWNYYQVKLDRMSAPVLVTYIEFISAKGKTISAEVHVLRRGNNMLKIPVKHGVATIKITMNGQAERTFRIVDMKLRQKYFTMDYFLRKAVTIFLIYVAVCILICQKKRTDWYFPVDFLQNFFIRFGDAWGGRLAAVLNAELRRRLQVFCFTIMFILMIVMDAACGADYAKYGRYWMFAYGVLLVLAGLLSWKSQLKKLNWRNSFCFGWFVLWTAACISDLFVRKSFPYVGYIMIFGAGFAFFVWHNSHEFLPVLLRMLRGLEWTLPGIVLYCMFFRQKKPGVFYNGAFLQHETMAMYALALLLAFLVELNILLRQRELYKGKVFVCGLGAGVSASLLYYSRTRWCMAAAAVVLILWGLTQVANFSDIRKKMGELLLLGGAVVFFSGILVIGINYGIKTLPEALGTGIMYADELQKTELSEDMIGALEAERPGWSIGVIREDETSFWDSYAQKLNLLGNEDNLREEDRYLNPHNGILQMMHRYGMLIFAPYLTVMLLCIYSAWKGRGFLWKAAVLAYVLVMLFENPELPFTQPLWMMLYLGMGSFFDEKSFPVKRRT